MINLSKLMSNTQSYWSYLIVGESCIECDRMHKSINSDIRNEQSNAIYTSNNDKCSIKFHFTLSNGNSLSRHPFFMCTTSVICVIRGRRTIQEFKLTIVSPLNVNCLQNLQINEDLHGTVIEIYIQV